MWLTRACAKPAIAWASPGWSARSCAWARCASWARRCGPISTRWRALTISPHPARRPCCASAKRHSARPTTTFARPATLRHGEPMLAEAWREQALVCQQWLRQALAEPFDGTTVVVTHFAPSLRSSDQRYGLTPGTAGFCNSLDALLPRAQLWLHGHLHCQHDYVAGGCRVVANTLGYAAKGEQEAFREQLVLDVPVAHNSACGRLRGPKPHARLTSFPGAAMKILLAVDGSEYTRRMLDYLISHTRYLRSRPRVHVAERATSAATACTVGRGCECVAPLPRGGCASCDRACDGGAQSRRPDSHVGLEAGSGRRDDRALRRGGQIRHGDHGDARPWCVCAPRDRDPLTTQVLAHCGVPVLLVR